jgi:hypothetical protein
MHLYYHGNGIQSTKLFYQAKNRLCIEVSSIEKSPCSFLRDFVVVATNCFDPKSASGRFDHPSIIQTPREQTATSRTVKMSVRDLDKIMGRLSVNENVNPYAPAKPVAKVLPVNPSLTSRSLPQNQTATCNSPSKTHPLQLQQAAPAIPSSNSPFTINMPPNPLPTPASRHLARHPSNLSPSSTSRPHTGVPNPPNIPVIPTNWKTLVNQVL